MIAMMAGIMLFGPIIIHVISPLWQVVIKPVLQWCGDVVLVPLGMWLGGILHLPFGPYASLTIVISALTVITVFVAAMAKKQTTDFLKSCGRLAGYVSLGAVAIALYIGAVLLLGKVIEWIEQRL